MSDRKDESSALDERLHEILVGYLEAERAGRRPDREQLVGREARWPEPFRERTT
jgi:hypothetical protein